MRKAIYLLVLSLVLIMPMSVKAFETKSGESIYLSQSQEVEGNYYAVGQSITIDGTIKGDLICAGQTININGVVEGDIICAGQSLNINNEVGGNVRVAGNAININSKIQRNVMVFGAFVNIGTESEVGGDVLLVGAAAEIRGKVIGEVHGSAAGANISGEIGKGVRLRLDDRQYTKEDELQGKSAPLIIGDKAVIGGGLIYTSRAKADISNEAKISGEVEQKIPKLKPKKDNDAKTWIWNTIFSILSALLIGIIIINLWKRSIINLSDRMMDNVGASIGWGLLVLLLAPVVAIILLFTIIGIPLSLILIVLWLVSVYISKVIAGIVIGRALAERFMPEKKISLMLAMIFGVVVVWLITSIPVVGWLLGVIAVCWGLGGLWWCIRKAETCECEQK